MNPAAAPVASVAPAASLHRFDAYRIALAFRAHVVRWLSLKRAEFSDQCVGDTSGPLFPGGRGRQLLTHVVVRVAIREDELNRTVRHRDCAGGAPVHGG